MENAVRKVNKERNTNIEALKLLAILLIIIFHIVQTLTYGMLQKMLPQ